MSNNIPRTTTPSIFITDICVYINVTFSRIWVCIFSLTKFAQTTDRLVSLPMSKLVSTDSAPIVAWNIMRQLWFRFEMSPRVSFVASTCCTCITCFLHLALISQLTIFGKTDFSIPIFGPFIVGGIQIICRPYKIETTVDGSHLAKILHVVNGIWMYCREQLGNVAINC